MLGGSNEEYIHFSCCRSALDRRHRSEFRRRPAGQGRGARANHLELDRLLYRRPRRRRLGYHRIHTDRRHDSPGAWSSGSGLQNSRSGFLGGAQAGYNWQSGWAVFGVQADIAGADIKGTVPCLVVLSCTGTSNWLATASGRVGAVVLDRGLVYVKGGAAWLNTKHAANLPNLAGLLPPGTPSELTSKESNTWGWMLGMGTEWMITRNWTAFIEYDYIEFEKKNEAFPLNPALLAGLGAPPGASVTFNTDLKNRLSIAKVGVNYKFDWGTPVAARY
jgi:outer membrane immunogenic protein